MINPPIQSSKMKDFNPFLSILPFLPVLPFYPFCPSSDLVICRPVYHSIILLLCHHNTHTHTHTESTHTQRPVSLSSLSLFLFHFILSLDLSTSFQMHALELLPPCSLCVPFHPSSTTALSSRGSRNLHYK